MMNADIQHFRTRLTKVYTYSGLPQSVAAVLAHLTICDPSQQTAADIQTELRLSAGSVSSALNLLVGTGLVARSRLPGDKRFFYELESHAWENTLNQRVSTLSAVLAVADEGQQLMPDNKRLTEMRDFYNYFATEFGDLILKYRAHIHQ